MNHPGLYDCAMLGDTCDSDIDTRVCVKLYTH